MSGPQDSTRKWQSAAEVLRRIATVVENCGVVPNHVNFHPGGWVELSLHGQVDLGAGQYLADQLSLGPVTYKYDLTGCSVWRTQVRHGFEVVVFTVGILHPEQVTS